MSAHRMAGRTDTTLRNMRGLSLFYRRFSLFYPIFHTFSPEGTEHSAHQDHNNCHTLGGREPLCASYSSIILNVEPRAPSSHTRCRCTVDQHGETAMYGVPRVYIGWYTPWWVGSLPYPGWYIPGSSPIPRVVYTRLLSHTQGGTSPIPRVVPLSHTRGIPKVCSLLGIPQGVPCWVYLRVWVGPCIPQGVGRTRAYLRMVYMPVLIPQGGVYARVDTRVWYRLCYPCVVPAVLPVWYLCPLLGETSARCWEKPLPVVGPPLGECCPLLVHLWENVARLSPFYHPFHCWSTLFVGAGISTL